MYDFTLALIAIIVAPPLMAPVALAVRALDRRYRRSRVELTADARRAHSNALIG